MKKLECVINNKLYEIVLDKYKILYGNDLESQYNIVKCFKSFFNKITYSEYTKENNLKIYIKLNESFIDVRSSLFFEVNYDYDFINDSKLGTKSLILKYYEHMLEGIEYDDSFYTIKELLNSFVNLEMKDRVKQDINKLTLLTTCDDFNFKTLIKLLVPSLIKDLYDVNNTDLSYEEVILFQLKLINSIALKSKKKVFVICNIPLITKNILAELEKTNEQIILLSISNKFPIDIKIDNIIFTDLNWLDFNNENILIDFLMNCPFTYDVESLKQRIINELNCYNLKNKILLNK